MNEQLQMLVTDLIEVLNKIDGGEFGERDEKLLEALCTQAGVAIVRARLTEAFIEKQRIEESIKLAGDIQMGMIPTKFPAFPETITLPPLIPILFP